MKDIETKRLSNDELETVSGGSRAQNEDLLSLINGRNAKYNGQEVTVDNLAKFLSQYGIMALINNKEKGCNNYTLYGERKSHDEIMEFLSGQVRKG